MVDTGQTRGQYSFMGTYPQVLPDYWVFDDGTVRTDLPELSDDELELLGWVGPIQMPPVDGTSEFTHRFEWDSETLSFYGIELSESQIRSNANYQKFWDELLRTNAYQSIKSASESSLKANTLATEFISLITDAKRGQANVEKIQESLLNIVSNISFSADEMQEIQFLFEKTGLFAIYTLDPQNL